ncbi:MAG: iron complex outermembrane receptor protein [Alteromonadaceae bacterium]|jgi:outer membrane receptor protein involved in Fe transport
MPQLDLSFRLDNLFDHQYYTFGTYGEADEVLENIYPDISSVQFVGPAKPRGLSVSLNYQF